MNKKEEKEFEVDIEKLTAGLEHTRNIDNKKRAIFKFKYIVVVFMLFAFIGFTNSITNKQEELRNNPWASECNDITDYEYTLENNYIKIDEYIGKDKKIKLCKNYVIDAKEYELTSLGDEVFQSKNIFSVLFPNSIISLPSKIFYKSNVKYLYLPRNLTQNDEKYQFSYYLDSVEKIYYEGNKTEWEFLIDYDKEINEKVDEIIFETNYEDLNINE